MSYFYRPSVNGFFSTEIHGPMQAGDRELTDSQHADLMRMQSRGCTIRAGDGGMPTAEAPQAPPPVDPRSLRAAAYRRESDPLFFGAMFDDTPEAWATWRAKVAEIKGRFPLAGPPPVDPR